MTVHYEGGYYLMAEPIVRGADFNGHTANDLSALSDYTVESINHIQDTAMKVNPFILDVVTKFFEAQRNVNIVNKGTTSTIVMIERPLNPRENPFEPSMQNLPAEAWELLSKEERKSKNAVRAKVLTRYEEDLGVYRATRRVYETAREMSQFDHFYFPHNMDFRLRIYPIPTDLTPQSNDLSKGLLAFAQGTRLGAEGHFWMGVSVATHWGEDKLSMKERFDFSCDGEFLEDMQSWVDNPMKFRGWLKADKPFQFLAVAHEWVWANRMTNPDDFISFLPGNLDGSCNGAQHLSIMARDMVGAEATNCTKSPSRNDLYMEVADRVWEKVERDAAAGNLVAIEWVPKIMDAADRRKVVKRSVMTVPYGVTEYGVADFMIKDKHVDDNFEHKWDSAKYMRDLILDSIDATLSNGRKLQRWFQACAIICAEAGLPLVWDTPAGSKVTQAYRNVIQKRIRAFDTRFVIYQEADEDEDRDSFLGRCGMDVTKMGTSAPPNVVHSCDAAHLQITVCRMYEAGIRNFSMIHDSFGCPFSQVGLMRDILRDAVVDMYRDDYLQVWKESVERYSGLTMPEPPALGEFDIEEIRESEFFFS